MKLKLFLFIIFIFFVIFLFLPQKINFINSSEDGFFSTGSEVSDQEYKRVINILSKNYTKELGIWFENEFKKLSSLSLSLSLSNILPYNANENNWSLTLNKSINLEKIDINNYSGGVYFLNENGIVMAQLTEHVKPKIDSIVGHNFSHREYFTKAKQYGIPVATNIFTSADRDREIIVLAAPVLKKDKFLGIVDVVIDVATTREGQQIDSVFSKLADKVINDTKGNSVLKKSPVLMLFDDKNRLLGISNNNIDSDVINIGIKKFYKHQDDDSDSSNVIISFYIKNNTPHYKIFGFWI